MTDHDVAAFVDVVAGSVGEAGRWVHHGLTSSDVLDTGARAAALAGRRWCSWAARTTTATRSCGARASTSTRSASAAPTACTPSRPRSASSSPASPSRRTATCAGSSARPRASSVGALSGAVGTYAANGPEVEAAVLRAARARPRGRVDAGRAARPPRRAARGDRAGGRRARALRHRDPPPAAHRGARGRGAVPRRGPEGLVGDAAQAQPDRDASASPGSRGCCAATPQAGLENVALWHERDISHSSVERVALPDATILLDYAQHLAVRVVEGMVVHADRMRREPGRHARGALLAARAARARRGGALARRRVPDRAGGRPARLGRGDEFRDLLAQAAPELDLDAVFDPGAFVRHARELVGRLDRIA